MIKIKHSYINFFKTLILLGVFLLYSTMVLGQTVSGIITNTDTANPIPNVFVQLKDATDTSTILTFSKTDDKGFYKLDLSKISDDILEQGLLIEASKMDHGSDYKEFSIQNRNQSIELHFQLSEQMIELETIHVVGKIKPIKQKKDTVIFNAEAFKNGNESTVEDLLKNMPGIEVDEESGNISYLGRPIESLLLEGDDLFGNNYTTGSRNISSDIIKEVEAIDKWTKNPLLRGIEESDKVSLNLKLKKNAINFSGTANVGIGNDQRRLVNANIVSITSRYKNFSTVNHNNVSDNNSPYNYFTTLKSKDEEARWPYLAPRLITPIYYSGAIHSRRTNQNNQWYAGFNHIQKLNDQLNIRINAGYMKDAFNLFKSNKTSYHIGNGTRLTQNEDRIKKEPKVIDFDFKTIWLPSENTMLELESKWLKDDVFTAINSVINNTPEVEQNLQSKSSLWMQKVNFTHKLNDASAYQIILNAAKNNSPQDFSISPSLDFFLDQFSRGDIMHQRTRVGRSRINLQGLFMSQTKHGNMYQLMVYTDIDKQTLLSNLSETNDANDLHYRVLETKAEGSYGMNLIGFNTQPTVTVKYYNIQKNAAFCQESNKVVLDAKLKMNRKFDEIHQLFLETKFSQEPQPLANVYEDYILLADRSLKKNVYQDGLLKTWNSLLQFTRTDITHQFKGHVLFSYMKRFNQTLANHKIFKNYSRHAYYLESRSTNMLFTEVMLEKYLPLLSSTVRLKSNYTVSNYFNQLNNNELRENKYHNVRYELFYKTAFDIPLNLENVLSSVYSVSKPGGSVGFSNHAFTNRSTLYFVPNKVWFSSLSSTYYKPSLQHENSAYFLDFLIKYKPKNKNWSLTLKGTNLTNNKTYSQRFISDYYRLETIQSLNQRYVFLKFGITI